MDNSLSRRRFLCAAALLSTGALVPDARAFTPHHQRISPLIVTPFNYDPYNLGLTSATFVNRDGFLVLHLVKTGPTDDPNYPLGNASGATVTTPGGINTDTVGSITLSEIGFIISTDSQDGGGAPRFNVYDNLGNYWFFGFNYCQQYGTTTVPNTVFNQITVNPANIPLDLTRSYLNTPAFTNSTIVTEIDIIFDVGTDEGKGFADITHVTVNNQVVNFNAQSVHEMKHRPPHP